jgi:hypothetical protein
MKAISRMSNQSDEFEKLYTVLLKLRDQISGIHEERLERCALEYFAHFFRGVSTVEFRPKLGGVQMGSQAHVTFPDGTTLKYHIKTHSGGRRASHSSAAKLIDPRELLVYKFLAYIGMGCESHFFHQSLEDVFIATLDAGVAHRTEYRPYSTTKHTPGKVCNPTLPNSKPNSKFLQVQLCQSCTMSEKLSKTRKTT